MRSSKIDRYNWYDGVRGYFIDGAQAGDLLMPIGVRGDLLVFQRADRVVPSLADGELFIARHEVPEVAQHSFGPDNIGIAAMTWMTLKDVDTRGGVLHAPVYLGRSGKWQLDKPATDVRLVGKILRVGGPTQDAESGVVLLTPNMPARIP